MWNEKEQKSQSIIATLSGDTKDKIFGLFSRNKEEHSNATQERDLIVAEHAAEIESNDKKIDKKINRESRFTRGR